MRVRGVPLRWCGVKIVDKGTGFRCCSSFELNNLGTIKSRVTREVIRLDCDSQSIQQRWQQPRRNRPVFIVDVVAPGSYDESIESPSHIVARLVDIFIDRWPFSQPPGRRYHVGCSLPHSYIRIFRRRMWPPPGYHSTTSVSIYLQYLCCSSCSTTWNTAMLAEFITLMVLDDASHSFKEISSNSWS